FGPARLGDVEARQADRRRHDVEVTEDPGRAAAPATGGAGGKLHLIHKEGRGDSEAHDIDEAVELRAKARAGTRDACDAPVQCVEDAGEDDEPAGAVEFAARRQYHRPDAEEQVEQGEEARHHDDDATERQGRWSHGYCARTVPPTRTLSPGFTFRTGRAASGRNTSVRDPNRMRPSRSPCFTRSPGFASATMLRAIKPAICRTSTRPRGPRMPSDDRPWSTLAFPSAAC